MEIVNAYGTVWVTDNCLLLLENTKIIFLNSYKFIVLLIMSNLERPENSNF